MLTQQRFRERKQPKKAKIVNKPTCPLLEILREHCQARKTW